MNTTPSRPAASWWRRTLLQLGRDVAYLLVQLPLSIATFVAAVTLGSISLGTAILWVGVPLGAFTLLLSSWIAALERRRLHHVSGRELIATYAPAPTSAGLVRRTLHTYTDPQRWRDFAYAILDFPVGVVVSSIAVAWVAMALTGPTVWLWDRFVPSNDATTEPILTWLDSVAGQTTIGMLALVSLPWVARGLVLVQQGVGWALLRTTDAERLRLEVSQLEHRGRSAASAEALSLRRIERDLHDGPQQRLLRLAMEVQRADAALDGEPAVAREALAAASAQGSLALAELRQLTRGIAPPILVERGLVAALDSLAERGTVPVDVEASPSIELDVAAETALYFVASEALANVEKHAHATRAHLSLTCDENRARLVISDDGQGGAHPAKGHGLAGLAERVTGAGGTLEVSDGRDGGTVVIAEVPCG